MICGTASRPLSGVATKRPENSGWLCCLAHSESFSDPGLANPRVERFKPFALSLLALADQWTRPMPDLSLQVTPLIFAIPTASILRLNCRRSANQGKTCYYYTIDVGACLQVGGLPETFTLAVWRRSAE